MNSHDIAIVGMECVFPGACNLQEYWTNLADGVEAIREVPPGRLNGGDVLRLPKSHDAHIPCSRGGFLPERFRFDPLKFGIMPKIVKQGDPDQFLMLHAIGGALSDAGVAADAAVRERTDVIVGRGGYISNKFAELNLRADLLEKLLNYFESELPGTSFARRREELEARIRAALPPGEADTITTCVPNLVASRAANRLNLRGAAYTVDAACASSLIAVEHAVSRLRYGQSDLAVAGGVFLCQQPGFWYIFARLNAISRSSHIRPFDRRADGLLIGEGGGAVVLKRLEDATRDGDRVYAIIKGVGSAGDGHDTHILNPSTRGQIEALKNAYRDAGVDPATIGYLEAHGTGTQAGDQVEMETIKQFFGTRGQYPPKRAMGSVKSMIGHTMPAAGIASLIKMALSLSNKCLVPSLNCEQPHELLREASFYINREVRPWIHSAGEHPRRAGVNAFGFGGINAHVVLEEVPEQVPMTIRGNAPTETAVPALRRPHSVGSRWPSELLVLTATTVEGLAERLQQGVREVAEATSLQRVARSLLERLDFTHPHKLAVVCADRSAAERVLSQCMARLRDGSLTTDDGDGIYYGSQADRPAGKVAGMFPGLGFPGLIGNYPIHLMELCRFYPDVRREFDKVQWRDGHPDDPVSTEMLFYPPSSLPDEVQLQLRNRLAAMKALVDDGSGEPFDIHPSQRNLAAPGVTLANLVSWLLMERLDVPVDMVCGQSQGEIAALCAAGVVERDTLLSRLWLSLEMSPEWAGVGRLALACVSEERLNTYLGEFPDVSIAIHIAPEILIIGGKHESLPRLVAHLQADGRIAKDLPYPPVHTPLMRGLRDLVLKTLNLDFPFGKPNFPVYSAITASPFPDDKEGIRELAINNLHSSVRFWQTLHRIYDDGARIFIQIGGGTMASNIRTILPKPDIISAAVDLDHRNPITQLQHLSAVLLTSGVRFDVAGLYGSQEAESAEHDAERASPSRSRMELPLQMDWAPVADPAEPSGEPHVREVESPSAPVVEANESIAVAEQPGTEEVAEEEAVEIDATPPVSPESLGLPFVDEVLHHMPRREIVVRRVLDLGEDLFLHDHSLIDEATGKPVEHRLPTMPMTVIAEALAETAVCLAPELGVVGLENLKAVKWINMLDCRTNELRIEARLASVDPETGVHRVETEIHSDGDRSASADVLLGSAYREDVRLQFTEPAEPRAWPVTPEQLYADRYAFHGPLFQCISQLDWWGDDGFGVELTVRPMDGFFATRSSSRLLLDPVVWDGVNQSIGMWTLIQGIHTMPAKIGKLELYRPAPPPGTRVPVRVQVRSVNRNTRTVTADAEVQDGSGQVWFRVRGITKWLFEYSPPLQQVQRSLTRYHLSTAVLLPGVEGESLCALLPRDELRHATIDWVARMMLHQCEMDYYDSLPSPKAKRQWLMGRIAAKDAVRLDIAQRMGTEMVHPAHLVLGVDEAGRPAVCPLEDFPPMPEVSIAHTDELTAALTATSPCGIDIEPVDRDVTAMLEQFANADEIALLKTLERQQPEGAWPLRLWCAKQAAGKAAGAATEHWGSHFVAVDGDPDGSLLIRYLANGCAYHVQTLHYDSAILAFALASSSGPLVDAATEYDGNAIE